MYFTLRDGRDHSGFTSHYIRKYVATMVQHLSQKNKLTQEPNLVGNDVFKYMKLL